MAQAQQSRSILRVTKWLARKQNGIKSKRAYIWGHLSSDDISKPF